jgi:tetratricopeptide (TPR) repeat protein
MLGAILLAWSPALASVEAELAFHRGVVAYREGRLPEARALFEKVVAEDPQDSAATHYLGLISQAQGDTDGALRWYGRTLELAPEDTDARFDLGTLLLEAGRLPEASAEFDRVLAAQPDRAPARLFAGIVRYRAGAYPEALRELERAATLDAELQPEARYYAGLCEAFLGNFADAAGAFSEVEEQSPVHPLARSAGALRRQVQPPQVTERPWQLEFAVGGEWDSNTLLVGEGRTEPEDLRAVLRARGRYRLVDNGGFSLRLGYDGYGSLHEDRDEVDLETHVGSVSAGMSLGRVRLGLAYDLAYSFVDPARDFRRTHGLTPTVTLQQGSRGVLQLFYQFQDLDYFRSQVRRLDRDGHRHAFGFNQFVLLPERRGYVRVGALQERVDTSGTEFRYDGYEISVGVGVNLPRDVEFTALYRRKAHDYTHQSVFEPVTTRRDRIDRITTDLVLPLGARWEASLAGAFTFQHSDVGVYDYNRTVVGSYLTYRF